jgi:spermidine synthase
LPKFRPPVFEHLDSQHTPLGLLSLRRRTVPSLDHREVHEVVLGDAFLMSSLFTVVEEALSDLGLAAVGDDLQGAPTIDVVVGGLGLGFTAQAALAYPAVKSCYVVDYLEPVIDWHQRGLVPLGKELSDDSRCHFVHGDFFKLALAEDGEEHFAPGDVGKKFHAILLDIDHSPTKLLHERHAAFYEPAGLRKMANKLHPSGVFGLWSDDAPDESFLTALREVFTTAESHIVTFDNPIQDCESQSTVYVAKL